MKELLSFNGVMARMAYFCVGIGVVTVWLAFLLFVGLLGWLSGGELATPIAILIGLSSVALLVLTTWVSIASLVKRLRHIGHGDKIVLAAIMSYVLMFVPFVGFGVCLYLLFVPENGGIGVKA